MRNEGLSTMSKKSRLRSRASVWPSKYLHLLICVHARLTAKLLCLDLSGSRTEQISHIKLEMQVLGI